MPLASTNSWYESDVFVANVGEHDHVDVELMALQRAVADARRHSWAEPDPIEPELANFLAALTRSPSPEGSHRFIPDHAARARQNSWREVLEDAI